jgi:LysM domain
MRSARALSVVIIFMASLVSLSISLESFAAAAISPAQDALHEVLPGDNLRMIAGYYYGDARQWERIWNANRDQIRNPNRIERGTLLRIPNATVPTESYLDFVGRARRPLPPQTARAIPAVPAIPPAEAQAPDGLSASPEPPAKSSPDKVALPAPAKAPAPALPTAAAPSVPPQKAAAPAASPAPQPTKALAAVPTPGAQPPAPSATPAPAPAKGVTTPPGPPAAGPTKGAPPPPPPKAWYEEWGLDELVTSPLFLGGVAVLVLGLAAIQIIRRRRSAANAVAEVPE